MIRFWLTSWVIWWEQISFRFFSSSLFHFLPVTLKLAYFAPLNGACRIFPVNFNYPRCLENSNMTNFWLICWVIWWGQIFFGSFLLHIFHFFACHFEVSYFAPLNGAGQIFPENFNYPRCLENSNMINVWLTSWVIWWRLVFFLLFFFFTFCPRQKSVTNNPLSMLEQNIFFDNLVTISKTRGKKNIFYKCSTNTFTIFKI